MAQSHHGEPVQQNLYPERARSCAPQQHRRPQTASVSLPLCRLLVPVFPPCTPSARHPPQRAVRSVWPRRASLAHSHPLPARYSRSSFACRRTCGTRRAGAGGGRRQCPLGRRDCLRTAPRGELLRQISTDIGAVGLRFGVRTLTKCKPLPQPASLRALAEMKAQYKSSFPEMKFSTTSTILKLSCFKSTRGCSCPRTDFCFHVLAYSRELSNTSLAATCARRAAFEAWRRWTSR
jgi:hypothetical protein